MPRPHTAQEREAIKRRLMEVGEENFTRLGLRKTTIADLARDAGIGKGSFYHFFQSKEDLFLAIQEDIEAKISERFQEKLKEVQADPPQMVRSFFEMCINFLETHPFLKQLADPEIVGLLTRSAPPERLARMRKQDLSLYRDLFGSWVNTGVVRGINAETLFGILTAIFVLNQHQEAFKGRFEAVMSWIVDAICAHAETRGDPKS